MEGSHVIHEAGSPSSNEPKQHHHHLPPPCSSTSGGCHRAIAEATDLDTHQVLQLDADRTYKPLLQMPCMTQRLHLVTRETLKDASTIYLNY